MLPEDSSELQRLTDMLGDIDATLDRDSPLREGLTIADLALRYVFTKGLRADLEQSFSKPAGKPLTESQLAELDAEIARLDKKRNDPEA